MDAQPADFKRLVDKRFWYLGMSDDQVEFVLDKVKALMGSGAMK